MADSQGLAEIEHDQYTALEILPSAAVPADGELDAFGGRMKPLTLSDPARDFSKTGRSLLLHLTLMKVRMSGSERSELSRHVHLISQLTPYRGSVHQLERYRLGPGRPPAPERPAPSEDR